MWVPGGLAYLLAGLVHAARVVGHDRPAMRMDATACKPPASTASDVAAADHLERMGFKEGGATCNRMRS